MSLKSSCLNRLNICIAAGSVPELEFLNTAALD
jgi:hypothetical protein